MKFWKCEGRKSHGAGAKKKIPLSTFLIKTGRSHIKSNLTLSDLGGAGHNRRTILYFNMENLVLARVAGSSKGQNSSGETVGFHLEEGSRIKQGWPAKYHIWYVRKQKHTKYRIICPVMAILFINSFRSDWFQEGPDPIERLRCFT